MQQVSARVPEEVDDDIEEFSDENDVTKSEAIRTLLERGLEYDRIQTENERLEQNLQQLIQNHEEHTELAKFAEKERSLQRRREERQNAPVWQRAKWWLFGTPIEDDQENTI